jgi:hypothetical protein
VLLRGQLQAASDQRHEPRTKTGRWHGFDVNVAAMGTSDLARDRQAQPGTARSLASQARTVKGLEDPLALGHGDAWSAVFDRKLQQVIGAAHEDTNYFALR